VEDRADRERHHECDCANRESSDQDRDRLVEVGDPIHAVVDDECRGEVGEANEELCVDEAVVPLHAALRRDGPDADD